MRLHAGESIHAKTLVAALTAVCAVLFVSVSTAIAAVPTVSTTTVSAVTTKAAVLEADVDPEGEATTYHFEYGLADCLSNPCASVPVPNGNVGSGSAPLRVKAEITGLAPATTYHFRVVASNGSGTTDGPDRTFTTYAPPSTSNCPNEELRTGPGASLPDCRAYEMVSPVDKNGGDIMALCNINCRRTALNQAATGGGKLTYSSYKAFGDALGSFYSNQYLATRTAQGWVSHSLNPLREVGTIFGPLEFKPRWDTEIQFKAFTDDLSTAWITDDSKFPLTPDGLEGYVNVYERDNAADAYEALTTVEPTSVLEGPNLGYPEIQGHSEDGSHVVFSAAAALTPDAAPGTNRQIYDYSEGELHLVSMLPGETASTEQNGVGTSNDEREGNVTNAVSEDGSRVFWSTEAGFGNDGVLYVRIDNSETIPISQTVTPSQVAYLTATSDGSEVLFETGPRTIYRFDVDTETPEAVAGESLGLIGTSDDFSHIYFISEEDLAEGATAGERNVYLDRNGVVSFIATVAGVDTGEGSSETAVGGGPAVSGYDIAQRDPSERPSRVTPDGRHMAFQSVRSLTGYDNTDANNGEPNVEVFVYDADSAELTCASCNPSGARPAGRPLRLPFRANDKEATTSPPSATRRWTAAWLPHLPNNLFSPRALSDDGNRLYFNAFDALLPQDTNNQQDVYQWEAAGSGTCQKAGGCISLISTGESPYKSEFIDASPDGGEVFFETNSSIDPRDPGLIDIYVARVGGGFPYTAPTEPCIGDACQVVPPAPDEPTPASASFKGSGDPAARADCRTDARRAARLNSTAERLRRQARDIESPARSKQMRKRAARLARRAEGLSENARRCRRTNRRAGR